VGVGTATFRDPRATVRITDELVEWCARHGVARVADLSGALTARNGGGETTVRGAR
jgi:hypothetical protein